MSSRCHQLNGDAIGIAKLKRGVTVLQNNPRMINAHLSEVRRPGIERFPIRNDKGKMVQNIGRPVG